MAILGSVDVGLGPEADEPEGQMDHPEVRLLELLVPGHHPAELLQPAAGNGNAPDCPGRVVVVGDESALEREEFMADRCNWIAFEEAPEQFVATTKIRYNHPGTAATVTPLTGGKAKVKLHVPQRAITPGQAAVNHCFGSIFSGSIRIQPSTS